MSLDTLFQDLRIACRVLRKNRAVTSIAILTLSLGLAATTSVFAVVQGVLLRPLPYPDADRIALLRTLNRAKGIGPGGVSPAEYLDWQVQNRVFDGIAAFLVGSGVLTTPDGPERVLAAGVTSAFFQIMGVQPAIGRFLLREDEQGTGTGAVVLSFGLWQRCYGAAPDILGKVVNVNGRAAAVVGVMPRGFAYPSEVEIWTVLDVVKEPSRAARFLEVVARVKRRVGLSGVQTQMDTIASRLAAQYPETNVGWTIDVTSLQGAAVAHVRPALLLLLGSTGLVLLISIANVTNLLMARAIERRKEVAIRVALGATRLHIFRQFIAEGLLIALLTGIVGVLLAAITVQIIALAGPPNLALAGKVRIDSTVVLFSFALSILACIASWIIPLLRDGGLPAYEILKEGSHAVTRGIELRRFQHAVVCAECALSLVLLIGAALLVKSFIEVRKIDLGFQTTNILTMRVVVPNRSDQQRRAFFMRVTERLKLMPGVQAVGASLSLPLHGNRSSEHRRVLLEGSTENRDVPALYQVITPDYFKALGIPLRSGRVFTDRDTHDSPPVAIVSELLGRLFSPTSSVIGRKLRLFDDERFSREIVGVVGDVKWVSREGPPELVVYVPYAQDPVAALSLTIRTEVDPSPMIAAARREIRSVDPDQPIYAVRKMDEIVAISSSERVFTLLLSCAFAILAAVLAVTGVYAVVAFWAKQRTNEFGIRMALGATVSDIVWLLMQHALKLAFLGICAGTALAIVLTRFLRHLLFAVTPGDPVVFVASGGMLTLAATVACYFSARRVTYIQPASALKIE